MATTTAAATTTTTTTSASSLRHRGYFLAIVATSERQPSSFSVLFAPRYVGDPAGSQSARVWVRYHPRAWLGPQQQGSLRYSHAIGVSTADDRGYDDLFGPDGSERPCPGDVAADSTTAVSTAAHSAATEWRSESSGGGCRCGALAARISVGRFPSTHHRRWPAAAAATTANASATAAATSTTNATANAASSAARILFFGTTLEGGEEQRDGHRGIAAQVFLRGYHAKPQYHRVEGS